MLSCISEDDGGGGDGGNPLVDGVLVLKGEEVGLSVGDGAGAAAGVFQFDQIGADALNLGEDVLAAGGGNGDDQDERGGADDHAEGGESKAHFGGTEAVDGQLGDFAEHHGLPRAGDGALEGEAVMGTLRDHLFRTGCHRDRVGLRTTSVWILIEETESLKAGASDGKSGGERGIRTLDRAFQPYNGLANRRLQPLGHLSGSVVASI